MFETIGSEDAAARLRAAAVPPLAGILAALAYLTIYPLFTSVPAWMFWCVALVLLAGAAAGAVLIVRVVRREPIRGRAIAWLIGAIAVDLACARWFLAMTVPWL